MNSNKANVSEKVWFALWVGIGTIVICLMFASLNFGRDNTMSKNSPSIEETHKNDIAAGIAAAKTAGIELPHVTWEEIKAQREALGEDYLHVFWINPGMLYVSVKGGEEYLTPSEAIEKYGSNEDFVREYAFLMM